MRRLFRGFERVGLRYLLISGQASVLYGAATFSEDIDLWIRPDGANARRLLQALATCRARVYKLTPALTSANLAGGHGFHFVIPANPSPTYLDVMGCPPRVGRFGAARRASAIMDTDWGRVPVVSIEDLVLLKLARRLSDYEVISNLVRGRVDGEPAPSRELLRWAVRYSFRVEDRMQFQRLLGQRASLAKCAESIAGDIVRYQRRDVRYWRTRIDELRRFRRAEALLPEGLPVARLLRW